MLAKQIKHEDYMGNARTTEAFFNLSQEELLEIELSYEGGLEGHYQSMVDSNNPQELLALFRGLIKQSYGVIEDGGASFDKSPEHFEKFKKTAAYQALFDEVMFSADNANDFFLSIMPKALREQTMKQLSGNLVVADVIK